MKEGVIKYDARFRRIENPLVFSGFADLNGLRKRLYARRLIGKDPMRYDGAGYGNVSMRIRRGNKKDVVVASATQTGGLPILRPEHYSFVTGHSFKDNAVTAFGVYEPSSEVMTHLAVYGSDPRAMFVAHAHSPELWRAGDALCLPFTPREIEYGTPEMAEAVEELLRDEAVKEGRILVMKGHEDGIITWGKTAGEAGDAMFQYLQAATQIEHPS